jgi:hypothetical protein
MPIPNPVRLFHITAIANLPDIFANGELLSKNSVAANGIGYENIAHQGAQEARAVKLVPNPPSGNVHDFVPFYFAPRSPMLFAINGGRVQGCNLRQADIVHFETTVDLALAHGQSYVFYDTNATLAYSNPYTDIANLNAIAWDLITEPPELDGYCKFWQSNASNPRYVDRMAKRMAEFLVKSHVPLTAVTRIGVINAAKQQEVSQIVAEYHLTIPTVVVPDWYF